MQVRKICLTDSLSILITLSLFGFIVALFLQIINTYFYFLIYITNIFTNCKSKFLLVKLREMPRNDRLGRIRDPVDKKKNWAEETPP